MKPYGYITLKEAEEISGVSVETLKKQCQTGRIRGAVKEAGSWFVPRDEIIIKPVKTGHPDDSALILMVILAEISGLGVNVTLYMNGLIIEGMLISTERYLNNMRENTAVNVTFNDPEAQQMVDRTIDSYYESLLKRREEGNNDFVHLERVTIKQSGSDYEPIGALLRLRLDAIDGFQLGTTKRFEPLGDQSNA